MDIQSLITLAGTSDRQVDEISSGVSTCKSKKETEMFSVQCQVPYNLVKRKHAAVQENSTMCTKEVQTDVVLSVPEADRHNMDSILHSSMYFYKSKEDPVWLPLDDSTLSEQSFQQEHVNEAKERNITGQVVQTL
ncbi:uncharacterized protein LOC123560528 [Mercenaria mercenaria]|uniref:uncharacterized protein LOC123560528 n=1 Tax=Mercenaria mercenaria TaxID=6596 RepID=UPI00234F1798|nr:uncharacterized protein LOC123560528 [Mercenaria mercenaria]